MSFVLDALAVHRLTRLIVKDKITQPPREWVIAHAYGSTRTAGPGYWEEQVALDDEAPTLATFITCAWCAGMWVALGVVIARRFKWWRPVRDALALSSAATFAIPLEPE